MVPLPDWVWALNALQNSMMLMLAPPSAGPTGGAGDAWPAGIWSLMTCRTFFAMTSSIAGRRPWLTRRGPGPPGLLRELLDLVERELGRRLAPEDADEHLEAALLGVDLGDLAGEVRQRPGDDLDALALGEVGPDLRPLDARDVEQAVDLGLGKRHGLVLTAAAAYEAGHPGGVLHQPQRVRRHVHVDEDVAGQAPLLGLHLLPVLGLHDLLGRDDHVLDPLALAQGDEPVLQVGLDLLLVARVGVDDVPAEHSTPRRSRRS